MTHTSISAFSFSFLKTTKSMICSKFEYKFEIRSWSIMFCNSFIYIVQQFTTEVFTHIEFEMFAHSRWRINEKHINNVILNENPFMFILMSIFHLYVFNDNNKMIHRHKMSNSLNNRKFELLLQLNFYILKKI